jgi:flagellar protein FliO/FliZ
VDTVILAARVIVSLGVVVALLWGVRRWSARWALKRGVTTAAIEVAGKRSVGSKANVVVVDVDGIRFVLGVTEHNVSVLHAAPAPETEEAADAPKHAGDGEPRRAPDFARILARSGVMAPLTGSSWKPLSKTRRGRH